MKTQLRDTQRLILHVGLGKTGTTTLQTQVFPRLAELGHLAFNPGNTQVCLNRMAARSDYACSGATFDFSSISEDTVLLSDERLIGWNPAFWTERCAQIDNVFGSTTTILLTLREPESYLRSMFQQQIHQGNVLKPKEFFLPREEFVQYQNITRVRLNEICDVDALDYQNLVDNLRARFARVIVLPFPKLLELDFLKLITDFPETELADLLDGLAQLPRKNQSYSNLAMRLTYSRERLLNLLGLKSLGTHDRYRNLGAAEAGSNGRGLKRMLWPLFTWRGLMQATLPKLTGYKPYALPKHIHRGVAHQKNIDFFERLKREGILSYNCDTVSGQVKDDVLDEH